MNLEEALAIVSYLQDRPTATMPDGMRRIHQDARKMVSFYAQQAIDREINAHAVSA